MHPDPRFLNDNSEDTAKFKFYSFRQKPATIKAKNAIQTDRFPTVDEILDRVTQKTKSVSQF